MNTIVKSLGYGLLLGALGFSSCTTNDPATACLPITIDESDFFSTDQTLTNHCDGVDYIITKGNIASVIRVVTANLVIEPGTTIEFENGAGLSIAANGSIRAVGTAGDGAITLRGTDGGTGDWLGVIVYSGNSTNQLRYTTGGGGGSFNSNDDRANLVLYANGKISVDNCTFQNSATFGFNASYESAEILSFSNNTFTNNQGPIRTRATMVDIIDATNTFSGHTENYVLVQLGGDITNSVTWKALSIPYRLTSSSGGIFTAQAISSGGVLTLEPGLNFEFEASTSLIMKSNGALNAVGTASAPITFSGATATPGFWSGLFFDITSNPLNQLTHVVVEHAGSDSNIGAISMRARPRLTLSNVTLRNISGGCAIYDSNGLNAGVPTNPNYAGSNITFENVGSQYCD